MAFNSGRTDVGHQACPLQMLRDVQTCSAADVVKGLDIHWVVHRIVWDQLDYREVGAHWVPQMMTKLIVWDCMGLSCIYWTCYTDQREQFRG